MQSWFIVMMTVIAIASAPSPASADSLPTACSEIVLSYDRTTPNCTFLETSLNASIDEVRRVDPTCPAPTVLRGNGCVLGSDLTLSSTLDLASATRLNCQGHRVTPSIPGSQSSRSKPEVAILVNGAHGVTIQNCVIDGFDFGVTVIHTKVPRDAIDEPRTLASLRNRILSNTISSRYIAVEILNADNSEVKDNDLLFSAGSGRAVAVYSDSDLNLIRRNRIVGNANPIEDFIVAPGSPPVSEFRQTGGVTISSLSIFPLINLRIGNTLLQFPWNGSETGPDDNLVEGNMIDMITADPAGSRVGILLGDLDRNGAARENSVLGGAVGIGAGAFSPGSRIIPGACSYDQSRRSLSEADCFIPGVDGESQGVSTGAIQLPFVDTRSRSSLIEGNMLQRQGLDGVQLFLNYDSSAKGNAVSSSGDSGISIGDKALETATVSRNIVRESIHSMFFFNTQASEFYGAKISLNDLLGNANSAIGVLSGYALPSELSVNGRGNYWGHTCSEGGFLPSDTPDPVLIKDSHPYGVAVATTSDRDLPPTCK